MSQAVLCCSAGNCGTCRIVGLKGTGRKHKVICTQSIHRNCQRLPGLGLLGVGVQGRVGVMYGGVGVMSDAWGLALQLVLEAPWDNAAAYTRCWSRKSPSPRTPPDFA